MGTGALGMKFEHATLQYQFIRKFAWRPGMGDVSVFRINKSNGYRLVFRQEQVSMYVPGWMLHDIERRGVPFLGIRPSWVVNEVFYRIKICFHRHRLASCYLDQKIGTGGSLHEASQKFFTRNDDYRTGKYVLTQIPWLWDFSKCCMQYWRNRTVAKVRFLMGRGPYWAAHLRFHYARFTRPIRFFYDRLKTSMGRRP